MWALFGIRDVLDFTDPGAKELISLHETLEGAEEAKRLRDEVTKRLRVTYFHPDGHDYVEVRAIEIKEP